MFGGDGTSNVLRMTLTIGVDELNVADGAMISRDLTLPGPNGTTTIRRGTVVDPALRARIARLRGTLLHVVSPGPGDVEQGRASQLVAESIVGDGITLEPPHQGQVIVRSQFDGLLRVRGSDVIRLNRLGTFLLATALDGRVVESDETVAVVKASSLWVPTASVDEAINRAGSAGLIRVRAFSVHRAAFVAGTRVRAVAIRGATGSLRRTLGEYDTDLAETVQVSDDPPEIARTLADLADRGTGIALVAGSIVLDPGDPFLVALESSRSRIVLRGAPIDPGTMFWVAYVGEMVVFGLASCEMYGRLSVLDLMLPYALAREEIDQTLIAELGYGGLLHQTYSARRRGPAQPDGPVDDGS